MTAQQAPGRFGSLPGPARRVAQWLADTPVAIAVAIAVALVVVGEIISPGFASYGQIVSLLRVSAFLGIIAMGQTIVIISGGEGIDLSVGKVATFSAIIAARTIEGDNSQVLGGLALALLVCAGVGLVNGIGIAYTRIPPLVMTLGMIGVVQGLILLYTGGTAGGARCAGDDHARQGQHDRVDPRAPVDLARAWHGGGARAASNHVRVAGSTHWAQTVTLRSCPASPSGTT